jgi:hypothetical protein
MEDRSVDLPFANRTQAGRLLGRRLQAERLAGPLGAPPGRRRGATKVVLATPMAAFGAEQPS